MSKEKSIKNGVSKIDFSQFADCMTVKEIKPVGNHASGLVPAANTHCVKGDFNAIGTEYLKSRGESYAACLHASGLKGFARFENPAIAQSVRGEKTIGLALCCGSFIPAMCAMSSKDLSAVETGIIPLLKKVSGIASCYTRSIGQRMREMNDAKKFRMIFADVVIKNDAHKQALIACGYTGLVSAKTGETRVILAGIKPLLPTPDTDTEKGKKTDKKTTAPKTAPKVRKTAPKKPATVTPETAPNVTASV